MNQTKNKLKQQKYSKKAASIQTLIVIGLVMLAIIFMFVIAFGRYESFTSIIGLSS